MSASLNPLQQAGAIQLGATTTDPLAGTGLTAVDLQAPYQIALMQLYGADPFAPAGEPDPDESSHTIDEGGPLAALNGVPHAQEIVQEIIQALLGAYDDNGQPLDWDASTVTSLALKFVPDPEIQRDAAFGSQAKLTSLLKLEFQDAGIIGSRNLGRSLTSLSGQKQADILQVFGMTQAQYAMHEAQRTYLAQFKQDHAGLFSLYSQYFGQEPSITQANEILAHGSDAAQWEDYIRSLPSHLAGVSIGRYTDTRGLADQASKAIYGFGTNDTIVKHLIDQGWHSQADVQFYYDQLPFQPGDTGAGKVDPKIFNEVAQAGRAWEKNLYNDEPHPERLDALWKSMGSPTSPQGSAALVSGQAG